MKIKFEDWVCLKSDHTKEYNVRGVSNSGCFLERITLEIFLLATYVFNLVVKSSFLT